MKNIVTTPIKVNNLELHNRIVMPPIASYKSTPDGKVTDDLLNYYGARAKGGNVALITTEHSYIALQGKAKDKQLSIADDSDIEGLSKLTAAIHQTEKAGSSADSQQISSATDSDANLDATSDAASQNPPHTKAFAQLNHAGSATWSEVTGMPIVSSSSIKHPGNPIMGGGEIPEELTKDQIKDIVRYYVLAARRAKAAGYDGVEIHSAHSYLLNQFYSPLCNKRTDEYGGSLDNRIRFHLEVISAVRKEVGPEYPISIRLGGSDYMEGGSTIEDSVYASKEFEAAGIDMISVSGGLCRYTLPDRNYPGYFKDMSSAIKAAVSIPVMLTGGIKTIEDAEALLEEGACDLVGIGRELMKDPNWADEALEAAMI